MSNYTLQRIFDDLSYGELSQVNLSGKNSDCECGEWDRKAEKTIVSHLNMALDAIYTRFPLLEKEVTIQLYPELTHYRLESKYAETNTESDEPIKYIKDSEFYPFTDDILRVESCFDEGGFSLPINDRKREYSIFTPDYNSIQVPFSEKNFALFLIYRARHPVITTEYTDANEVLILLPPYLYEALLCYITYRVHKARSNQEAQAEAVRALQLYETKCKEVETRNMTHNDLNVTNTLLDDNGWK